MTRVLISGCVLAAVGAGLALAQGSKGQSPQGRTLTSPVGRYQFGQISDYRRDQYVFDTQTGRLWRVTLTSDSLTVLDPILYSSLDNQLSLTPH